jgi:hypothetical protein
MEEDQVEKLKSLIKAVADTAKSETTKQIESDRNAMLDIVRDGDKAIDLKVDDLAKQYQRMVERQGRLETTDAAQAAAIEDLKKHSAATATTLEATTRATKEHQERLDGTEKDGVKELSIEGMRREQSDTKSMIDGTRWGIKLESLYDKVKKFDGLAELVKWGGGLSGIVLLGTLLGVSPSKGPSIEVLQLQSKVAELGEANKASQKAIEDLRVEVATLKGRNGKP